MGREKDDISDMIDSETAPDLSNQQIDAQVCVLMVNFRNLWCSGLLRESGL